MGEECAYVLNSTNVIHDDDKNRCGVILIWHRLTVKQGPNNVAFSSKVLNGRVI